MDQPVPQGIDPLAVARVLGPHVGGLAGPLQASLIAGGRSNLTYVISDGERDWVLRRPPLAHVLPTAHDMAREYRVITALGPTSIPVPETFLLCADSDVLGAPFYVMERVQGHIVRDRLPDAYPDDDRTRWAMSSVLISTLADLHAIDPEAVGLGDFGRPAGFLERQVRRWWQQWELSKTRDLPEIEELKRRLVAGMPESQGAGIVHGDYRLDNTMLSADDPARIAAILDWEMCTLGDPLADVGLLLVYWADRTDPPELVGGLALAALTAQPGFMTRAELVGAYGERTGRDLSSLEWYVALGYYKLAIIAEGIHARFLMGMTLGEGFEQMGPRVPAMVNWALERASASGVAGLRG
ncbi:MAG TPA: phosphotransferase family protein [Candidatus Dormibacteraeota bacterium]|jgi:aminoglycoside phosphotransferase (APT) family kinase protein|nr:phosphotransferase family protein [Candidatus Dormibacteraeota bacterium]